MVTMPAATTNGTVRLTHCHTDTDSEIFGAIAEYPPAREHKLLAPAVPQWPIRVMQLS